MLKNLLSAAALFLLTSASAHAANQDRLSDAVWVETRAPAVVVSTAVIAIDLSDTSNFPHKTNNAISIVGYRIDLDKAAASTATVKIGVVTSVNASSGTVTWFLSKEHLRNVSNAGVNESFHLFPAVIRAYVSSSGTTPEILSSNKVTLTDTEALEYQNDVPLPTTAGTHVAPARGDIIVRVIGGGASATAGALVDLLYFSGP